METLIEGFDLYLKMVGDTSVGRWDQFGTTLVWGMIDWLIEYGLMSMSPSKDYNDGWYDISGMSRVHDAIITLHFG